MQAIRQHLAMANGLRGKLGDLQQQLRDIVDAVSPTVHAHTKARIVRGGGPEAIALRHAQQPPLGSRFVQHALTLSRMIVSALLGMSLAAADYAERSDSWATAVGVVPKQTRHRRRGAAGAGK